MIAIIPARGGSKGLPGKNIRDFCGKPLICHSIKAALEARCIDRVLVSTDDAEIARIAGEAGAEIPFLRPTALATDTARAVDVYNHLLDWLEGQGTAVESFCVLLPTAPLRQARHIDEAGDLFLENCADSVLSITTYDHPIEWALSTSADKRIAQIFPEESMKNRQDFRQAFRPNGAIYLFSTAFFRQGRGYYGPNSYGYYMDPDFSIDIDTALDMKIAEVLYREKGAK